MIMRIILILIIGGCILLGACQDITPGYLQTEYAGEYHGFYGCEKSTGSDTSQA